MYYPYDINDGNCVEIFLSRVYTVVIIFGELHQVYVIAMSLGLGNIKITLMPSFPRWSLVSALKVVFAVMVVSVLGSFVLMRHVLLDLVEDSCTVVVSLMQMYIVRMACKGISLDDALIPATDSAVSTFEQLTRAQLVTTLACIVYRVAHDLLGLTLLGDLNSVLLNIDAFCIFLFYAKTVIIKEKTSVVVVSSV